MCGMSGFIDLNRSTGATELAQTASSMAKTLQHRGPDDAHVWADEACGIAIGFQRLSIIDLSSCGRQPMASKSGRYIIAFNGEIYNAAELREELVSSGSHFNGHADTEVLLEAIDSWGLERTLPRLIGMFAIVLWDRRERELILVRDRLGIKPLCYGKIDKTLFFGSQPMSFRKHPAWQADIDRDSLSAYMRFGYVPSPMSIFKGVAHVNPAEMVVLRDGEVVKKTCYWDLQHITIGGQQNRSKLTEAEATDRLEDLLSDAIKCRMIADVPLGAFLSGGIDSSTVVALMQKLSSKPVKTFCIGFEESTYSEAKNARKVAEHLGTDHHELTVSAKMALDVMEELPGVYDEPFSDPSQIPTLILSRLTRKSVTVSLSGDGGDELLAGYDRYHIGADLVKALHRIPAPLRGIAKNAINATPGAAWKILQPLVPRKYGQSPLHSRALRFANFIQEGGEENIFRHLVGQWPDPELVVREGRDNMHRVWFGALKTDIPDFIERMQHIDTVTYLPDNILTKVDRASMAAGLEARVPLLDHRVVEFCQSLPRNYKIRDGQSKWILRQLLGKFVPDELINRPKMGFGIPIDEWLRGPLRDWSEDLLSAKRLKEDGLLNADVIRSKLDEHLSGKVSWAYMLWTTLMFQNWKKHVIDNAA